MSDQPLRPCAAFQGHTLLFAGPRAEVALAVKKAVASGTLEAIMVFDDATGRIEDFDLRGSDADVIARLSPDPPGGKPPAPGSPMSPQPRGRGRPKLGVVSREITLLPRHWEWLAGQPGGASVTLRKLVEQARRTGGAESDGRAARDAAYRVMAALGGDLPGFEEATRSLFAGDRQGVETHTKTWPADVRAYALGLAFNAKSPPR